MRAHSNAIPYCCLAAVAAMALVAVPLRAQGQEQVNVSVKIIEYQMTKGVETGLSAYFKQRNDPLPYGRVTNENGVITSADLTFPASTSAGITVFLDRLTNRYGDFEVVLQGLVDENRASILSQPNVMAKVGSDVPTIISATQRIPYENTVVVGSTTVQTTNFRDTGVQLTVNATDLRDEDGDFGTTEDTYIRLTLNAVVNEEGQRIVVALDDQVAGGVFTTQSNAITAPEFVSRGISTDVWVRHGQVLVLGGLFRTSKGKDLTTLPWLPQANTMANGLVRRVSPINLPEIPLTTGLGNQSNSQERRELVFLVKAERWKKSFTLADEFGFEEEGEEKVSNTSLMRPTDLIQGVIGELSEIPQGIAEGITGEEVKEGVSSGLGADEQ